MKIAQALRIGFSSLLQTLLIAGCASKSGGHASASTPSIPIINTPAKTPLHDFRRVQLKGFEFDTNAKGAAKTAVLARELDTALLEALQRVLVRVTAVPAGGDFPTAPEGTLQITPRIEKARVVTPSHREWHTWAAGNTDILLRISYRDAKTGELVAEPLFNRKAGAFAATWSNGARDAEVRENLVNDIADYTRANR